MKAITIKENEIYLRQVSKNVDFNDADLSKNLEDLEVFCLQNEVMALAAIQIGIPKRLVYLKNTNLDLINKKQNDTISKEEIKYNERRILINPVVIKREGLTEYFEACASCLDLAGLVKRPYKILVEYQDLNGSINQETFTGFEATVLSHELDHLNGILHIDIADEVYEMNVDERKKLRISHPYKIISKEGKYEELKNENIYI